VPLLLVMVAMLAVVTFIPEITLFVPRWLYGK
jgi:TRAP-type C4-dicarboxylate transport system permease large subunit